MNTPNPTGRPHITQAVTATDATAVREGSALRIGMLRRFVDDHWAESMTWTETAPRSDQYISVDEAGKQYGPFSRQSITNCFGHRRELPTMPVITPSDDSPELVEGNRLREERDAARAQVAELERLTSTCTCDTGPYSTGPDADCAVHGAIRTYGQAQAEIERLKVELLDSTGDQQLLWRENQTLRRLLALQIDDNPCQFDHNGHCQEHGHALASGETCPVQMAKGLLTYRRPLTDATPGGEG